MKARVGKVIGAYVAFGEHYADSEIVLVKQFGDGTVHCFGGGQNSSTIHGRLIEGSHTNIDIINSIIDALRERRTVA